jgi:hypothetical protein
MLCDRRTLICSLLQSGEGLGMRGFVCRLIFENFRESVLAYAPSSASLYANYGDHGCCSEPLRQPTSTYPVGFGSKNNLLEAK